jgi:hypothetical protein
MHGTIGTMSVMDRTGHSEVTWDPSKPIEVRTARQAFDSLVREGYNAFSIDEDGERGERIREFDPKAGKIMMVPQLVGG